MQLRKGTLKDSAGNPIIIDQDQVEGLETALTELSESLGASMYNYAQMSTGQSFRTSRDFLIYFSGDVSSSDTVKIVFNNTESSISFSSSASVKFVVRGTYLRNTEFMIEYIDIGTKNVCSLPSATFMTIESYDNIKCEFTAGNLYVKF